MGTDNGTLEGDVGDAVENAPIQTASVFIHSLTGSDQIVKLGPFGRFRVLLAPGRYYVFVSASGFTPTCKAISIGSGQTSRFNARLHADQEHLEENVH